MNTAALVILIVMVLLVIYGFVAVWSLPYEIAKRRDHPHADAIGAATWVSLFTLGALWPFLWIWALLYKPVDRRPAFSIPDEAIRELRSSMTALERRLEVLEQSRQAG
ncbi:DUF3302 domain-containing protein [Labrys okinawensis]|uniref:DUF3302 domain-containing protein n=1 Tax=Labrys okinawensis TaxID=346911 RepID=UPI0039BC7BAF